VDTPSGSRGTILVVDDDAQVRAIAARALADEGFDVLQAPDARSAIGLLHDPVGRQVCLVITDIVMPGMHGDDLGRFLQHTRPTLPVLYMSGYSRPHLDFLSPQALAHCWLQKPFSPTTLVQRALALCDPVQSPP
jgi:two-component system cell cycle sensor histidine kinase/response regulator CckA